MKQIFFLVFIFSHFLVLAQNAERANLRALDFLKHEDTESALPFLLQAANLGNAESQYNLAYLYQKGLAVEADDSMAHYWYMKAAEQNFVNAQFKVAYNYASGRGTEISPELAFYWTEKCALQNDPECISNIVGCYSDGFGVQQNSDSAMVWTIKAASLPDLENLHLSGMITSARLGLAEHYAREDFLSQNLPLAYMWYLIYNESKRDFSTLVQEKNIEKINFLELLISPEEKAGAKEKAEKQLKRPLNNWNKLYKVEH